MKKTVEKIIFVTISMSGGGTERVISILANYYVQKGIEVTILMIAGGDIAYKLDSRVMIKQISKPSNGSVSGRIQRITSLRKEIIDNKKSVVIAMGTVASMFTCLAMLGCKNSIIISERNDPNRLNHRPIKKYEKIVRNLLYIRADRIVFQTNMAREQFPAYIARKSVVISNPIEYKNEEDLVDIPRDKVILAAGRLTEQKNFGMLIKAFKEFHLNYPDYTLRIFGEGELQDELQQLINSLKLADFIYLEGFCSNLKKEMCSSQIYVSSSDWEGVSNTLMEAMVNGMSVIATDCPMGGSASLIIDDYNGKLIPVGSVTKLAEALAKIAADSTFREKIGLNAKAIKDELKVENIAEKWLGLME